MGPRINWLLLALAVAVAGQAWADGLPDTCGNAKVKFDVKREKSAALPGEAAEGKARVVLIESEDHMVAPFRNATVRFGMDGAWVGADYGDSYFALTVEPGEHHLCGNWQTALHGVKRTTELTSFKAEPGHTYYFVAKITVTGGGDSPIDVKFGFAPVDGDEGKFRVSESKMSSWKPKQ